MKDRLNSDRIALLRSRIKIDPELAQKTREIVHGERCWECGKPSLPGQKWCTDHA